AYATTATQALGQYRVQLATVGSTASSTTNSKTVKLKGTVERDVVIPNGDNQNALFAVKGNDTLWTVGTADDPKAVLMKTGDQVNLTGRVNESAKTGTVESYVNQTFK